MLLKSRPLKRTLQAARFFKLALAQGVLSLRAALVIFLARTA
jgi:hypothetical protein